MAAFNSLQKAMIVLRVWADYYPSYMEIIPHRETLSVRNRGFYMEKLHNLESVLFEGHLTDEDH